MSILPSDANNVGVGFTYWICAYSVEFTYAATYVKKQLKNDRTAGFEISISI